MHQETIQFPDEEAWLLPTSFGNTIRAFEVYPRVMYGLDAIPGWLRILAVIPKDYRESVDNAKAQVDFWLNLWFLSILMIFEYVLTVRPFLRRFSRNNAKLGIQLGRKAQNRQNTLLERAQNGQMSLSLWRSLYEGQGDVLKRFEQTLGRGAVGFALRIARIQSSELRPRRRQLTAADKLQQRQHPQGNR